MQSLRYLNTILSLIAILLTLNVYVMWSATPGGHLLSATTEVRAAAGPASGGGIPDAGKQRNDILEELKNISDEVSSLRTTLTDGSARVRLEGDKD